MTMTEDRLFATIAQPISVMNILLNILLIVVIRLKSGKEMSAYKHILTLQTLLSLGFASLQAVSLPYWISVPGAFVLMPTGILRDTPYGAWVCYVLCGLCGEVNVMLATTFLFNYINMCKPSLKMYLRSTTVILVVAFVHFSLTIIWTVVVEIFCGASDTVYSLAKEPAMAKNIQITKGAFMGFALESTKQLEFLVGLLISMTFLMIVFSICSAIMMFCGLKIYTMLKQNGRSRKTRSLQRKIFFMLLVQTCCPIVFLQTPSFFNIVSTATGFQQPNYLPFPLALLLQFYATSHFLSTILFIKDYRRYFISCFRKTVGRYRSASSIGTSELNVMSKGAAGTVSNA